MFLSVANLPEALKSDVSKLKRFKMIGKAQHGQATYGESSSK